MFRIRKALPALLAAAILWAVPEYGFSIEEDPYMYKTLVGRVYFEYEKTITKRPEENYRQKTREFKQIYNLDLKGYYLSPKLLVYDAGVQFTHDNIRSDASNVSTRLLEYKFRTTVLPQSAIPLTLYANRTESSSNISGNDITNNLYGLIWYTRIRNLPQTSLYAERAEEKGENIKNRTTNYRLNMSKNIGATENELDYAVTKTDNLTTRNEIDVRTIQFRNITQFSKNTKLNVGAAKSHSTSTGQRDSILKALTLSLYSSPSSDFNQSHVYTFVSNETTGKREGHNYIGNMHYRLSSRVNSSLGLTVDKSESNTQTTTSKSETFATNGSVVYRMTDNFTISEAVAYSNFKSNAPASSKDVQNRTNFSETTTLTYSRKLSWAQLRSSYGLSYRKEQDATTLQQAAKRGTALEHTFHLSLSNIDFNRFVGFNTSVNASRMDSLSGELSGTTKSYHADAFSKVMRRYVTLTGTYDKTYQDSWVNLLKQKSESYSLSAVSGFFKNTSLSASLAHTAATDDISGTSRETTQIYMASHNRPLLGGSLSGSVTASFKERNYSGGIEQYDSIAYNAGYSRKIFRTISWQAAFQQTETRVKKTFSRYSLVRNTLFMPLRKWILSAEHSYTLNENSSSNDQVESKINLKLTRTFVRLLG